MCQKKGFQRNTSSDEFLVFRTGLFRRWNLNRRREHILSEIHKSMKHIKSDKGVAERSNMSEKVGGGLAAA